MEIEYHKQIVRKTQDEFHTIDKLITGFAFDIHNEFGRFCDEKVYHAILAEKCRQHSISVESEVEILLKYKEFTKKYKIDLLVDSGVIYELKTVSALNDSHKQQLINYLLITNLYHGKLLNFRPSSVEYQFVSTTLNEEERYKFNIDTTEYYEKSNQCQKLFEILNDLLQEWGIFLDFHLYNEVLVYFLGGGEKVIVPVAIYYKNRIIEKQKMYLLDDKTAFHVSAITRSLKGYEKNIKRLIKNSDIENVQWINFNKRDVVLKTL